MKDKISLSLPNKPEYVSIARLTASVLANNIGFDIEDIEDIKVAVGEACNNSVMHGNGSINIDVTFIIENGSFIAEVMDYGNGFNKEDYREPDLINHQERGLGIFIMESLMDKVEIDTTLGNGTKIRMIKERL
ncbi:MAG: ATP-binding protein [Clostridiales bacterium]|nr:ATP-binding protein [Clostridiales bacterium]